MWTFLRYAPPLSIVKTQSNDSSGTHPPILSTTSRPRRRPTPKFSLPKADTTPRSRCRSDFPDDRYELYREPAGDCQEAGEQQVQLRAFVYRDIKAQGGYGSSPGERRCCERTSGRKWYCERDERAGRARWWDTESGEWDC